MQILVQYVADSNWTKGTHEVRFGSDFYNQHMNHIEPFAANAFHGAQRGFTFLGGVTSLRGGAAPDQFNSYAAFPLLTIRNTIRGGGLWPAARR